MWSHTYIIPVTFDGKFDEKLLRMFADEDEGRMRLHRILAIAAEPLPVVVLTQDVGHVDAAQQHASRIVVGEFDVAIVVMAIVRLERNNFLRRRRFHGRSDPKTT